jgi:hypothetical protein
LEVYGVDWEGLLDDGLLQSQINNNSAGEEWTSWVGRVGPPEHLNEVAVDPPLRPLTEAQIEALDQALGPWPERPTDEFMTSRWRTALAYARTFNNNFM